MRIIKRKNELKSVKINIEIDSAHTEGLDKYIYGYIVEQTDLFYLGIATSQKERKLNSVLDLEKDGLCQAIPAQDMLHE